MNILIKAILDSDSSYDKYWEMLERYIYAIKSHLIVADGKLINFSDTQGLCNEITFHLSLGLCLD